MTTTLAGRIALLLLTLASGLHAQPADVPAATRATPKYLAHLVTISPGALVYERFGHNMLLITDLTQSPPVTVAYDFGNFDFNERDFIRRFVFGDMRYWAEEKPDVEGLLSGYAADNRSIYRQELNLTDEQVQQLWINLRENIRDENRYYHYDYYTDNCSTRLRDHIDRVTGAQLSGQLKQRAGKHTYRWHTRAGMDDNRLLLSGIEFTAAEATDAPITRWEESFLPKELRLNLAETTMRSPSGDVVPMVRRSGEMNPYVDLATLVKLPEMPWRPIGWFGLAGALVGFLMAYAGAAANRSRAGRWLAAGLWGGWGLIAGLGGTLLVFMWGFTRHVATYGNENLLQLSPLAIVLVVLGPLAAFGRRLTAARWVARGLVAICILGVMLKAFPAFRQDNLAVIAFALLSQAGLLGGMIMRNPNTDA